MNTATAADTSPNRIRGSRPGARVRISGIDTTLARATLQTALCVIEPDNRSQRKSFYKLMPEIWALRNEGFTFEQIATLLCQCNFVITPGTARSYFAEMLATHQEELQAGTNEQILALAELKKATSGLEIDSIVDRVTAVKKRSREKESEHINQRLNIVFGADDEPQKPARPASPAVVTPTPPPAPAALGNGFGLLDVKENSGNEQAAARPGFFDLDEPSVPRLTSQPTQPVPPITPVITDNAESTTSAHEKNAAASPPPEKQNLQCCQLPEGVKPFPRRKGVPDEVYEPGLMEHPAIPGLILTLEQRIFGAYLEYVDINSGDIRTESIKERPFRAKWEKPIPRTETISGKHVVDINPELFGSGKT